jgi:hypothetical protein
MLDKSVEKSLTGISLWTDITYVSDESWECVYITEASRSQHKQKNHKCVNLFGGFFTISEDTTKVSLGNINKIKKSSIKHKRNEIVK